MEVLILTEFNLEGLKIKLSQVYYSKLNLIMPYITDSFRKLDNERLRRNIGICLNFQIDSPKLIPHRIEEMNAHNYSYEFPPRINVGIDDLDQLNSPEIININGILCLIENFQKGYRNIKEPYPTKPFNYSNAIEQGIAETINFQSQFIPDRVEELKILQKKLESITDNIVNAINLQDILSQTEQEQDILLKEVALKQIEAKVLGDELNHRSRHLYDGLMTTSYEMETDSVHSLYEKHYSKKFSFDYCVYTGWKIEKQLDIENIGLVALNNPMANNFQLWSKTKTRFFGEIKYLYYRNMGQLYFGPLRVDPSDIKKEIDSLKKEIYLGWQSYKLEIEMNNARVMNEALKKHSDDFAIVYDAIVNANENAKKAGGEYEEIPLPVPTPFDPSSVPQAIPTIDEFTDRFTSKNFRSSSSSRWSFIYDIREIYCQQRLDFSFRGWRFFHDESFPRESPKRYERYINLPEKQPLPLYYSVNMIRGFKVGFVSNSIVNGKQTTKIDWIDPENKNDLELLSNTIIIRATDMTNLFYQIIIVNPSSIEEAKDYKDIKVNLSLRFPLDFPVVDIRFHHEPTTLLKLDFEDDSVNINLDNFNSNNLIENLPVSNEGLYPKEVENDLPPSNIVYEVNNVVASELFGVNPDEEPYHTDWLLNL